MTPKQRIIEYKSTLEFYKSHPDGRAHPGELSFYGICDHMTETGESYPELQAVKPKRTFNYLDYWWAKTRIGVRTRIKKLNIMIEMAEKATK